ncbi:MAG: ADP-ribosylation factor family-domain-containing protein [Linnemannia elongata]|nr:MAG: ADP-ribosylation factor family-domain-containing protein [Linnemannia elongata]
MNCSWWASHPVARPPSRSISALTKPSALTPQWVSMSNISPSNGHTLRFWDLNGTLDAFWRHYVKDTAGIVYVVDSSEEDFMEDAKVALWRLFENAELEDAVLLVFTNKQDRLDAISVTEVKDRLELETRAKGLRWHIQGSSVVSGDGLVEGMAWMTNQLKGRTWRHALGM